MKIFSKKINSPLEQPTDSEGFHNLVVDSIFENIKSVYTIRFMNLSPSFQNFFAGQYVTIKVNIENQTFYRIFSISSIPNENEMTLTIKKIPGGIVTNWLWENIKKGDTLLISPPSGQFSIKPNLYQKKDYIFIAGGSGITPIFSMIQTLLYNEPLSSITLLYANRTLDSILFLNEITFLGNKFPKSFTVEHYISNETVNKPWNNGYITYEVLKKITNQFLEKADLLFYICGPEMMSSIVVDSLLTLGIDDSSINKEKFYLRKKTNLKEESKRGFSVVTIVNDENTIKFIVHSEESILDAALLQNIPIKFSCKIGVCGMCQLQCLSGDIEMTNNFILTASEIESGKILSCQSKCISNETILKMDI